MAIGLAPVADHVAAGIMGIAASDIAIGRVPGLLHPVRTGILDIDGAGAERFLKQIAKGIIGEDPVIAGNGIVIGRQLARIEAAHTALARKRLVQLNAIVKDSRDYVVR